MSITTANDLRQSLLDHSGASASSSSASSVETPSGVRPGDAATTTADGGDTEETDKESCGDAEGIGRGATVSQCMATA